MAVIPKAAVTCGACGATAAAATARFCASCGVALDVSDTPTGTAPRLPPRQTPTPRSGTGSVTASSAPIDDRRFAPGTVIAARYRIAERVGKGGMGEVYRADDLVLGQPVALKFLPAELSGDATRLARFYDEVRIARQITHPAVCRVHDVGEVEGAPFLSMEYVDGEDLSSLLRRIGRLPPDKALEIARQLAAGLYAAHAVGVLHRDLKPHNVMLDGRGAVRLTDFGLAGLAESFRGDEVRSGTPAYMSPEQISGREVTVASDLYALGAVLYELFTGRRPFTGRSLAELTRQHLQQPPVPPSELVPDIAPGVERAILACLEKDPARRPPSALAVAALLPGGDPLGAALAAGETPSPELVAAASGVECCAPRTVARYVASIAAATLLAVVTVPGVSLYRVQPFGPPPAVLEFQARQMLERLGHAAPADSAYGFEADQNYYRWLQEQPGGWDRLATQRPTVVQFWYRQAAAPLRSRTLDGRVNSQDPPPLQPEMAGVWLDMQGRLQRLYAVPPPVDDGETATPPDWAVLFREAGLDLAAFQATPPRWIPPSYADTRAAWEGELPGDPALPVRVEAAAWAGRPVFFEVVGAWTPPRRGRNRPGPTEIWGARLIGVILLSLIVGSALLARQQLRRGRGDRDGAMRIAGFAFVSLLASFALGADHVPRLFPEIELLLRATGFALFVSALLWLGYLAIEPYLRRRMPERLISWTRLLSGRLGDPRVGGDLLMGTAVGALTAAIFPALVLVPPLLGQPQPGPWAHLPESLTGTRELLAYLVGKPISAAASALATLLLFLLLRLALRRTLLAAAALAVVMSFSNAVGLGVSFWLAVPLAAALHAPYVAVLLRRGLVAGSAALLVAGMLIEPPLVLDPSRWESVLGWTPLGVIALLTVVGARSALGPPLPRPHPVD